MSPSSPERPKVPRMEDVAHRAGVSHQTVSRVLNGMPGVRPETRSRVLEAVVELGYRRNFAARLLASTRSRTVGVVTWGTSQFGPANVLLALETAARNTDYRLATVNVLTMSLEAFREAVEDLLERAVEAMVVIVPHETILREAQSLDLPIPTVVVEGDLSRTPLTVGVDNVQGARLATGHLLDLGHDTVVHISGPPGWAESHARRDGWRAELESRGRRVPPLRWGGDWSATSGYLTGRSLAREADVTAVFVANDQMALGLLRALREHGRRVPEDVSVVGFDDLPEAEYFDPALTTVRQDFAELGRRVMEVLERVLDGEEQPSVDLVPTTLVVRSSSAAPRRSETPDLVR
jgi:DNA-binding LacI/PurR family transcriptional regulator